MLKADANQEGGAWSDDRIAEAIEVGTATVERVRARFAQQGLDAALYRKKTRRSPTRSLEGDGEAHLVALTCSAPPEGTARWTLRLLANGMVERGYVDTLSHETVRQTLKKRNSSPG